MMLEPRHRAWDDIHALLPAGWRVGRPSFDPGRHVWVVVAVSPKPVGRRSRPEYLEAQGGDELAALTYLALGLRERRNAEALVDLRTRSREAYLEGAEELSRKAQGHGLAADELQRVIERSPTRR